MVGYGVAPHREIIEQSKHCRAERRALECPGYAQGQDVDSTPGKKPEPKPEGAKKQAFEQSLARLEEIVRKLESANLPLDDAMNSLEEGSKTN